MSGKYVSYAIIAFATGGLIYERGHAHIEQISDTGPVAHGPLIVTSTNSSTESWWS